MLARLQRAYTAALEDRARRLERERAADTARAVAQERARIARDMHDILAHAVSLMVVQAEAGPVVVRSDPERAEAAFDAIAGAGRDAMTQLRRILGVLKDEPVKGSSVHRRSRRGGPDRPGPAGRGIHRPARRAARRAASRARCTRTPRSPLPRGPGGPDQHREARVRFPDATVELDWTEDELTLTVTDDGRGPTAAHGGSASGGVGGHGLIGIRERAAACGGTARTGPGPDGGFRVVVRLPVAADRQAALG
jgi:signal transduction histidine kinase